MNVTFYYQDVVDAAFADPGEWYSVEIHGDRTNAYNAMLRTVGRRLATVTTKDGRAYVKIDKQKGPGL